MKVFLFGIIMSKEGERMKKLSIVMILIVFLLSGCETEEPVVEGEYVPSYELLQFTGDLGDFYEEYGMYYAGRYLDDGVHVLCLRDDAPEEAIAMAEMVSFGEYSSSTVRLVKYSYAELWHVRLMVESTMRNDGSLIYSIGIRDSENTINVGVDEDWSSPDSWEYYIQEGIITIHIQEPATF